MIVLKLKTNNTAIEQFDKIKEEFMEVFEALEKAKKTSDGEFFTNDLKKIISELHDLEQATRQLNLQLQSEEEYKQSYKLHLEKLQNRVNDGLIKVDEYIQL